MGNDRSTFQFYYTSYRGRYCENEKERKWNKDSIKKPKHSLSNLKYEALCHILMKMGSNLSYL